MKIRKSDMLLCLLIAVIALGMFLFFRFQSAVGSNGEAVVTIDGVEYGRYSLQKDRVEKISLPNGAYNVLEIKDGEADIIEASCPDGICVAHQKISRSDQTIVCLPNKMVVFINMDK